MMPHLPQRLINLGCYVLPVVPKQEKNPKFGGKNPSYFDKQGKPHPITWKKTKPTRDWLLRWFYDDHPYGYFLPTGWLDVCCIDFDQKHYKSQDAVDKEYEDFVTNLDGYILWTEQTPNGGYHVWVKLLHSKDKANYNFATDNIDRTHRGEVLVNGGAVISPTTGYELLVDNLDQFNNIPALANLESYGIYPTSKKVESSKSKEKVIEISDNYNPDAKLSIARLVNKYTQQLLHSKSDIDDRSQTFISGYCEIVGWTNFLRDNGFTHNDRLVDLVNRLVSNLGIEDKADRCIKSVKGIEQLKPSQLKYITKEELMSQLQEPVTADTQSKVQITVSLVNEWETTTNVLDRRQLEQRIINSKGSSLLGIKTRKDIEELSLELKGTNKAIENSKLENWKTTMEDYEKDCPNLELEFLVKDFMVKAQMNMICGKTNIGKSTISRKLAVALANGGYFLDEKLEPCTVIYHVTDEGKETFLRHVQSLTEDGKKRLRPLLNNEQGDEKWSIKHLGILEQLFKELNDDHIVFICDSLTTAISEPSNASLVDESINKQIGKLINLCRQYNVTLIMLHHPIEDGTKPYGIVEKLFDTIWMLSCKASDHLQTKERVLKARKHRDMGEHLPTEFICEIGEDELLHRKGGEKQTHKRMVLKFLKLSYEHNPSKYFTKEEICDGCERRVSLDSLDMILSRLKGDIEQGDKVGKQNSYRFKCSTTASPILN
jgi:hypothetical protein